MRFRGFRTSFACGIVVYLGVAFSRVADLAATSPEALAQFQRALTALHDFEYEEANEGFRHTQQLDPAFALAYWGEALTYYQVLWRQENIQAARHALARLGSSPRARAAKAETARDKSLLSAAEVLFGAGDAPTRHRLYSDAMARVYAEYAADPDIASLYALALLGTVSRSLIGYSEGGNSPDRPLAGSATQTQVGAILGRVLDAYPDHHGALHYLLHNYDDPEHARLALAAARKYATVAGGASHALHMPAHVFLQLGLWHDAASSDRAAYGASTEWTERKKLRPAMRNFHALSWLEYELLQMGRYREAGRTLDDIAPVANVANSSPGAPSAQGSHGSHQPLLSDLSSMRARFAIETRRWSLLRDERNFGNVDELLAIGMSAANTNNTQLAEIARQALAERAQAEQEGDLRPAIAIMEREVAALIARAGGHGSDAISILEEATKAELALPAPLGLPSPPKPAPELLGELLLEAGRPRDAQASFEQAVRRNPNRSLSVLGLARAAMASGETAVARERYRDVLANFDAADGDLPEVNEARTALAQANAVRADRRIEAVLGLLVTALAIAAGYGFVRASRRRGKRGKRPPLKTRGRR
jgi:tetratricopeptide (TPR) repeat protein